MPLIVLLLVTWTTCVTASAETLSLRQAVARALDHSPEVHAAQAQQEKAHQTFRETRAQFIPNLVIGSGLAATRGFPLSIEGAAPSLFQVQSTALILNRPQHHLIAESRLSWRAAESASLARAEDIAWRTASTYLELHKTRQSLDHARREIEGAARIEAAVAERVREGREIPLEGSKARLTVARLKQRVSSLEGDASVLETALRAMIGGQAADPIQTEETPAEGPTLPVSATAAVERALAGSSEVRRLMLEVEAREARVRSERAQRWPQIDLVSQYAVLSRANNYDRFFRDFERHNAQLGVSMRLTIFDGKRIEARVGQAEADLMHARALLAAARSDLTVSVSRAFRQAGQASAAREVARLELEVARESLGITLARFEEGRISPAELEQARGEENTRWIAFLDATFVQERARLEVLRQTGGLVAALQ